MVYVMLVGAYPFERPEDKHDNQKLQKMIQARSGWVLYACRQISPMFSSGCCVLACCRGRSCVSSALSMVTGSCADT
jgi:hypothetical protein